MNTNESNVIGLVLDGLYKNFGSKQAAVVAAFITLKRCCSPTYAGWKSVKPTSDTISGAIVYLFPLCLCVIGKSGITTNGG